MEPVVGEPHSESQGDQGVAVADSERNQFPLAGLENAREPGRCAEQNRRLDDQKRGENYGEHWGFVAYPKQFSEPGFENIDGTDHSESVQESAEGEDDSERSDILAARKISDAGTEWIDQQLEGGFTSGDTNIVVRAGVDAVETEGAIHVADFAGLVEGQLAAALENYERRRGGSGWPARPRCDGGGNRRAPAADAVFRFATVADGVIAHRYFQRRERGCDEIKLSDGADELAECGVLEEAVNQQDPDKIGK